MLHELDNNILTLESRVQLLPRSEPIRSRCIERLATARLTRHQISGQKGDLDEAIIRFTEATFLRRPWGPSSPTEFTIGQLIDLLAHSILSRANRFKQPDDVKCCIMYFRHLREQFRDIFPDQHVIAGLVCAMAIQVELKFEDADEEIEEMAGLCDELLNSDVSRELLTATIRSFLKINALRPRFGPILKSERVISCLRKAIVQLPELHDISLNLVHQGKPELLTRVKPS